jgi:hypothetical protein
VLLQSLAVWLIVRPDRVCNLSRIVERLATRRGQKIVGSIILLDAGAVVAWPERFNRDEASATTYAGLKAVTEHYLSRPFRRDDGTELRIGKCLIDANWGPAPMWSISSDGSRRMRPF